MLHGSVVFPWLSLSALRASSLSLQGNCAILARFITPPIWHSSAPDARGLLPRRAYRFSFPMSRTSVCGRTKQNSFSRSRRIRITKIHKKPPAKNSEVRWGKAGSRRGNSVYVGVNDYAESWIEGERRNDSNLRVLNRGFAYDTIASTLHAAKAHGEKTNANLVWNDQA